MRADRTAHGVDPSSLPGDFRENYRFLSELINCREKNESAAKTLEHLVRTRPSIGIGGLNRRQTKILKQFLNYLEEQYEMEESEEQGEEGFEPPVPAELEASIRIRRRSTWLPWEAEAIRKIERWRIDMTQITQTMSSEPIAKVAVRSCARRAQS